MARRTFDVVDIIEILVHWHAGRNNSEIAASLGLRKMAADKEIEQLSQHTSVEEVAQSIKESLPTE